MQAVKSCPHWKTSCWFVSNGRGKTFSFNDDEFQVCKASLVLQQVLMELGNKWQQAYREGVWENLFHPLAGEDMSMGFGSSSKTYPDNLDIQIHR